MIDQDYEYEPTPSQKDCLDRFVAAGKRLDRIEKLKARRLMPRRTVEYRLAELWCRFNSQKQLHSQRIGHTVNFLIARYYGRVRIHAKG